MLSGGSLIKSMPPKNEPNGFGRTDVGGGDAGEVGIAATGGGISQSGTEVDAAGDAAERFSARHDPGCLLLASHV